MIEDQGELKFDKIKDLNVDEVGDKLQVLDGLIVNSAREKISAKEIAEMIDMGHTKRQIIIKQRSDIVQEKNDES